MIFHLIIDCIKIMMVEGNRNTNIQMILYVSKFEIKEYCQNPLYLIYLGPALSSFFFLFSLSIWSFMLFRELWKMEDKLDVFIFLYKKTAALGKSEKSDISQFHVLYQHYNNSFVSVIWHHVQSQNIQETFIYPIILF